MTWEPDIHHDFLPSLRPSVPLCEYVSLIKMSPVNKNQRQLAPDDREISLTLDQSHDIVHRFINNATEISLKYTGNSFRVACFALSNGHNLCTKYGMLLHESYLESSRSMLTTRPPSPASVTRSGNRPVFIFYVLQAPPNSVGVTGRRWKKKCNLLCISS